MTFSCNRKKGISYAFLQRKQNLKSFFFGPAEPVRVELVVEFLDLNYIVAADDDDSAL